MFATRGYLPPQFSTVQSGPVSGPIGTGPAQKSWFFQGLRIVLHLLCSRHPLEVAGVWPARGGTQPKET